MRVRLLTLATAFMMTSVGLVLGACGTTSAATSDTVCHASGEVVCITQSSSARTVTVRLGETVEVTLSDTSLVWSAIRQVGPQLLRVRLKATRSVRQFRETFEPVTIGHTMLQATGAPRCKPSQACPQFLLLWRVQILVKR
jgi:hypothetical protein